MIAFKLYMFFILVIFLFALYEALFILVNPKLGFFTKLIALLVVIYVIYLGFQRNTYLPFLGPTVMPYSIFPSELKPKDANLEFTVPVVEEDNTKVLYWAAQSSSQYFEDPWTAYGDYRNVGVTTIKNNEAKFIVACPSGYKVPTQTLKPHIHYRVIYPTGIMGEVKTAFVNC